MNLESVVEYDLLKLCVQRNRFCKMNWTT